MLSTPGVAHTCPPHQLHQLPEIVLPDYSSISLLSPEVPHVCVRNNTCSWCIQGNIAAWRKNEGDSVAPGDILAEVETDKATIEWEAQEEGFIAKILKPAGSKDIPVGTPVAWLVEEADELAAFKDINPGGSWG